MTTKANPEDRDQSNTIKDPDKWTTGDEPMTGAQRSYLKTLSEEAHVDFDEHLTKAEVSRRIDELQQITGRGVERGHEGGKHASTNPGSAGAGAGDEATVSIGPE